MESQVEYLTDTKEKKLFCNFKTFFFSSYSFQDGLPALESNEKNLFVKLSRKLLILKPEKCES
jgi:hypothetical protein